MPESLSQVDRAFLVDAADYLEHPSFLVRASALAGRPLEAVARVLPASRRRLVVRAAEASLQRALAVAIRSLGLTHREVGGAVDVVDAAGRRGRRRHRIAVALSGAGGGLLGWPGLIVELPITTSILLRSIASIGRDFGEDLCDPAARIECLTVLGYGTGARPAEGALDSTYLATRAALADATRQAAAFVARMSAADLREVAARGGAPILVRLVAAVAARFNIVVTEKLVAQSLPVLGAVGGAWINALFIDHFNRVARFHFGIRRLERTIGADRIRDLYLGEVERARTAGRGGAVAPVASQDRAAESASILR